MAKKIVRGITEIKDINKQDFDTNNVNDILSDGEHNYIHRKKGNSEEYHNLTDNIKTISSDNTDLLTVTNNNKTNNTATLSPKHDAKKEQVLESTRQTISIHHGRNGTDEKTTVDTNPQKVLEHDKLKTGDGLATLFSSDETTIVFKPTKKTAATNLNALNDGVIWGNGFNEEQVPNRENSSTATYITLQADTSKKVQFYIRESVNAGNIVMYYRFIKEGSVTEWKQMAVDNQQLLSLLAQKQNTLTSSSSIGIIGGSNLRQLYVPSNSYTHSNGLLKTRLKSISPNNNTIKAEQEFYFIVKINQGSQDVTFTLNENDKNKFNNLITAYGVEGSVRINGCLFTLSDNTLTVSTDDNTGNNYVITFSDII